MSYDVLTQRFVHLGGTKEYQLTSIRDDSTGVAYTIRRWGKIGNLIGNKVERDDTRSGFHKEQGNREKRDYKVDAVTKNRLHKWSAGNWRNVTTDDLKSRWPDDWRLMQSKIGRGPSPEELQNVSVEDLVDEGLMEHPDARAKRVGEAADPAPPLETTTESNPNFGMF